MGVHSLGPGSLLIVDSNSFLPLLWFLQQRLNWLAAPSFLIIPLFQIQPLIFHIVCSYYLLCLDWPYLLYREGCVGMRRRRREDRGGGGGRNR